MTSHAAPGATHSVPRRTELLERLVDIVAEKGLEGVSVRILANRANVSIGTVQYYFSTKAELLLAAWIHVRDQAVERWRLDAVSDPVARLRAIARTMDSVSATDRVARVWLAFVSHAANSEQIAAAYREQWGEVEAALTAILHTIKPHHGADETADATAEFLGLMDGLTLAAIVEPDRMPPGRALRICQSWIDNWLGDDD